MATTSSRTVPPAANLDDATESLADWGRDRAKPLAIGAIAIAVAVAGFFLYRSSESTKTARGEAALLAAQGPLASRDLAAAERELRQVSTRYDGTAPGAQAQMLLAQVLYDQGKFQAGLDALKQADDAPDALRGSVRILSATGYEGLGRFADAATIYQDLAGESRNEARASELRASAARAHQLAGNATAARELWTALVSGDGGVADEARVRLGELSATSTGTGANATPR